MKKKNRKYTGLGLLLAAGLFCAGCGGASDKSMATEAVTEETVSDAAYATNDIYVEEPAEMLEEEGEAGQGEGSSTTGQNVQRKLIKTVNLNVETESFDELLLKIEEKTKGFEGYVESSRVYNGSYRYDEMKNASFTLRVPAEKLEDFLSAVSQISNITNKEEDVTDVTLQYVDMKSHKEALETEQERLLTLLGKAETVEDIITIESRLSEVRYQIESMESQLRTLDNQVSYSTVYLYIEEVKRLTPVQEQSVWEKISTGFCENVYRLGEGFQNFLIALLINLPYLLAVAVIVLVVLFIIKVSIKRNAGKQERKTKKQTEQEQTEQKQSEQKQEKTAEKQE